MMATPLLLVLGWLQQATNYSLLLVRLKEEERISLESRKWDSKERSGS